MTRTAKDLKPLLWEPENLVRAIKAAGVTLWSWNVDTDAFAMDDHAYDLWGIPRGRDVQFEDLSAHIHPADRDRVRAAFTATRAIVGPYETDFRIMIGRNSSGFPRAAKAMTPESSSGSCSAFSLT